MSSSYWVSLMIQDTESSKPWLCTMTDSCACLDEAIEIIEKGKKNYRVLSAWVDTYGTFDVKTTVLHECYVDAVGKLN